MPTPRSRRQGIELAIKRWPSPTLWPLGHGIPYQYLLSCIGRLFRWQALLFCWFWASDYGLWSFWFNAPNACTAPMLSIWWSTCIPRRNPMPVLKEYSVARTIDNSVCLTSMFLWTASRWKGWLVTFPILEIQKTNSACVLVFRWMCLISETRHQNNVEIRLDMKGSNQNDVEINVKKGCNIHV